MFFLCIAQLSLYEFATVMEFQKERSVFIREKTGKLYGVLAYYFSKLVIELPLLLALPMLENVLTFFGIAFRAPAFWEFYLVYVLTVQVGTSMGYLISCCFNDMFAASQVTPFAVMPSVLFGGLVVNLATLNKWISWMQYASPTRFAYEALLWSQWPNDEYGLQDHYGFNLGYEKCCLALIAWAVVYRTMALIFLAVLSKNAFK